MLTTRLPYQLEPSLLSALHLIVVIFVVLNCTEKLEHPKLFTALHVLPQRFFDSGAFGAVSAKLEGFTN